MMRSLLTLLTVFASPIAWSHHSIAGDFGLNPDDTFDKALELEFEGEVVRMRWGNPHPMMTLETQSGELVHFEAAGLGVPERRGLRRDIIEEDDRIKVTALAPTRARGSRHLILNILPSEGPELLMIGDRTEPHWPEEGRGSMIVSFRALAVDQSEVEASQQQASGIFRVWRRNPPHPFWARDLPVTEEARAARAAFDLDTDYPLMKCVAPGMPRATIGNAWPVEFVERDGNIVMHMEEFDVARTIFMDPDAQSNESAPTPLGYSVGRWEGRSLIVETTSINWPFFDDSGLPLSESVQIREEFILSPDEQDLAYRITITDPETFSEPVSGTTGWTWEPGLTVKPYDCVPDEMIVNR